MASGWGRNSWAEAPFKFGNWLFLPLMMTPAPSSGHTFLLTPFRLPPSLPESYCAGALPLRCPGQPGIWGISARGSGRGGLLSHHAVGTSIGPCFSRVGVCARPGGFGSRHVCSEQAGQASPPAGNSGLCLSGFLRGL